MALPVVATAMLSCSFGAAPGTLMVPPIPTTPLFEKKPVATIMENKPFVNIMPFGMCTSLSNPTVAAATSAALGVLTPMPCTPNTPAPWTPGSPTFTIGGMPALTDSSTCNCVFGGIVSVNFAGTTTTTIP